MTDRNREPIGGRAVGRGPRGTAKGGLAALALGFAFLLTFGACASPATEAAHTPSPSSTGAPDTLEPRLVALLYLRQHGGPDSTRAELYPVALLTDDGFEEARDFGPEAYVGPDEPPTPPDAPTVLDSIRRFTVYESARPVGRFRVREEAVTDYACTPVRVGLGDLSLEPTADPFDSGNPRLDVYQTGEGRYGLTYFVALNREIDTPDFARDSLDDPDAAARLRERIRAVGADSLAGLTLDHLPGPELSRTEPALTDFALYDLDRDGRWEATGRVSVVAEYDVTPPGAEESYVDTFDFAFVVWVGDRGAGTTPGVLLARRDVLSAGAWGEGHELVEVMDLDGDGTADPFYESSGWESNEYVIFRLAGGRLDPAFRGSGYGC